MVIALYTEPTIKRGEDKTMKLLNLDLDELWMLSRMRADGTLLYTMGQPINGIPNQIIFKGQDEWSVIDEKELTRSKYNILTNGDLPTVVHSKHKQQSDYSLLFTALFNIDCSRIEAKMLLRYANKADVDKVVVVAGGMSQSSDNDEPQMHLALLVPKALHYTIAGLTYSCATGHRTLLARGETVPVDLLYTPPTHEPILELVQ